MNETFSLWWSVVISDWSVVVCGVQADRALALAVGQLPVAGASAAG